MSVALFCELTVKPEHLAEFVPIIQRHAEACAAEEEGCVIFRVGSDRDDPNLIRIYEEYLTQADRELHAQTDRYAAFGARTGHMLENVVVHTADIP
jgi:quinol monooxygenase YgiN